MTKFISVYLAKEVILLKSTGIVRRIDDLGRIVIPKEIRRTLRIREGDPLEIFTDNSSNIIFKKYSIIDEISPFAYCYADILSRTLQLPVLITDRDHIVAASGVPKREFMERRITSYVEDLMDSRSCYSAYKNTKKFLPVEGLENEALLAYPIITAGDVIGSICLLKDSEKDLSESKENLQTTLVKVTSQFLGKHLED